MSPEETRRETDHDNIAMQDRPWVDCQLKRLIPTLTVMRRLILANMIGLVVTVTLLIIFDDANDTTINRVDTQGRQGGQAICYVQQYAAQQAVAYRERLDSGEIPDTQAGRDGLEALQNLADNMKATGVDCSGIKQAQRKQQQAEASATPR